MEWIFTDKDSNPTKQFKIYRGVIATTMCVKVKGGFTISGWLYLSDEDEEKFSLEWPKVKLISGSYEECFKIAANEETVPGTYYMRFVFELNPPFIGKAYQPLPIIQLQVSKNKIIIPVPV